MLDKILKENYKIENTELEFINNKPYLKNRNKFFSLSHSNKYIILAFSDFECGVDIEKIKERDFISISKRMKFKCNNLKDFYKEWTKYEAHYKQDCDIKSFENIEFDDYIITAVSSKADEIFLFYVQNGKTFSNLKI